MPIFSLTEFAKEQVLAVQEYSLLAGRSLSNVFATSALRLPTRLYRPT